MNNIKNKLLLGILLSGLIVNLLNIFNIQTFYLRAIFSFLFLAIVPGLLIMLIFKIKKVSTWEYALYTIGLSISFVIFTGLLVNWSNIILHPSNLIRNISNIKNSVINTCNIEKKELPLSVDNVWISKDNISYGYYNKTIVKSKDKGETWSTIYKFSEEGEGGGRVWVDNQGTIFAGRDNTGKMYMSKDGGNSWDISLKFVCQNLPLAGGGTEGYGTMWNIDQDNEGNLYVGEYGGDWSSKCAYIHKSSDGGLTWRISYNSSDYGTAGRHIHIVKVDKSTDYIYATQGDGESRAKLIRSTDQGNTWVTLQAGNPNDQYTSMVFFPDLRLFGTDSLKPNKVIKTSDDLVFSSAAVLSDKGNPFIWSSSKDNNDVAYFGTLSGGAGTNTGLYGSKDKGISWCKLIDTGPTTAGYQGINNISNFSSDNYAYYHNGVNNKTYSFKGIPTNNIKENSVLGKVEDKPLTPHRILVFFDIILLIFILIAYKVNKKIYFEYKFIHLNWLNTLLCIFLPVIPTLGVLGAVILNNGGANTISILNYIVISIFVFLLFLFRSKVNTKIYPLYILMISISFLLSGWLRSNYVSGVDINLEYQVFQITKTSHLWNMSDYINIYNSCLSLNIFPTILSTFLNINDQYIFKLFIPLLFSITPVVVYFISRKYITESLSFLAAFFFMSQPAYTTWTLIPIRQEVAFVFFSLSVLILLNKSIDVKIRHVLFFLFNLSMIVSHYSTAYIALLVYFLMYLIYKIYYFISKKNNLFNLEILPLSGSMLVLLVLFTYIWYSQLTFGFNYLVEFVKYSINNITNLLTSSVQAQGQSIFDLVNIFKLSNFDSNTLGEYTKEITVRYLHNNPLSVFYNNNTLSQYSTVLKGSNGLPYVANEHIGYYFSLIRNIFKLFGIIIVVIGTGYSLFKKHIHRTGHYILNLTSFLIFIFLVITPFISINYDLLRIYQQILIILSFSAVLGLVNILNYFKRNIILNMLSIFFICYMLIISRFTQQYLGGNEISMIFNNTGVAYSMYYTHTTDLASAEWLSRSFHFKGTIFADIFATTKLRLTSISRYQDYINIDVLPNTIAKNSYVYLNYPNMKDEIAFISYKGLTLTYNYPNLFLADNKNLVYNNGGSEVYK